MAMLKKDDNRMDLVVFINNNLSFIMVAEKEQKVYGFEIQTIQSTTSYKNCKEINVP